MNDFQNRVALITGAGSGIGRNLALQLAASGAKIAAIDLRPEGLASLAQELSGRPFASLTADVTDPVALRAAVAQLEITLGPIDLLFACAGVGRATPASSWNAEDINDVLKVNLLGVVNSIDAVLPGMRQRRSGHLVVLSSLASYRGMPRMAAYCASKAGCNALCDSLRVELAHEGIAVSAICPGWIRTPMTESLGIPAGIMVSVEQATRQILRAVRRRQAHFAFPSLLAWQVWLMRVLPRPVGDWMARQVLRRYDAHQAR